MQISRLRTKVRGKSRRLLRELPGLSIVTPRRGTETSYVALLFTLGLINSARLSTLIEKAMYRLNRCTEPFTGDTGGVHDHLKSVPIRLNLITLVLKRSVSQPLHVWLSSVITSRVGGGSAGGRCDERGAWGLRYLLERCCSG